METAYPSSMGPSSFFYYNPEPLAENRQHGHFSPHPHHQYNAPMAYYPSNIHYAHQQPMLNPAMIYQQGLYQPNMITPLASPRPIYHRQTALIDRSSPLLYPLDTDCGPTTPPLSISGSARSSPPSSSGILQTPVNGIQSFQEALAGIKQGCEGEVYTEIQGGKRWMSPSPPMTPVFMTMYPPLAEKTPTSTTTTNNGRHFIQSRHPISPAQSPLPISSASSEITFCDPRDLTVGSTSSCTSFDFSIRPSQLSTISEEQSGPLLKQESFSDLLALPAVDFLSSSGLPDCDTLFGLGSTDDFGTFASSAPADESFFAGNKRQRTDLISFSSDDDSFLDDSFSESDEDHLAAAWLLAPSDLEHSFCSDMSTVASQAGRSPVNSASDADSESEYPSNEAQGTAAVNAETSRNNNGQLGASEHTTTSGSEEAAGSAPASSARRGRKQSLTEDPSKAFVCHLCNRRFRRQEHLKRHYRSLHTHDKPFKCNDCGKSFSRSDNLAQHQRTHGGGTIPLDMLNPEDGEMDQPQSPQSDSDRMAQILYQAALRLAAPTTSESSSSVSEESDSSLTGPAAEKKQRKRKRDE